MPPGGSAGIAWGVAAVVAYLGLIYQAVQLIVNATNGQWSGGTVDPGIIHAATTFKQFGATYAQLAGIVVAALPVVIVATIVLGIIARVRPRLTFTAPLLIACGVLGLAASRCCLWRWWLIQRMAFSSLLRSLRL